MKSLNILIVEDSENDAILLLLHLKRSGYEVRHVQVQTAEEMRDALAAQEFDIVLSDYQMPDFSGLKAFQVLKESNLDIPFIILSGTIGEETAVDAMIEGVSDYMMKSNLMRLVPAIERELHEAANRRAKRNAEKSLKESEEKLWQAQKLESIGRLAGGIAHDFNNILTAINGYSELSLRMLDENNPICRYIEEIKNAGERAALMTSQLLAFSRRQIIKPQILNINKVIGEMSNFIQRLIGEDIRLVLEFEPEIGQIEADPGQMSQLIMNLAVNSRDAMPDGGTIKIETQNIYLDEEFSRKNLDVKPGDYVLIRISDSGSGICEEVLQHIFEPFFTTKEIGKGTGLGLSTVYGIVNQSGGHIDVQSIYGKGATFEIYLPRVDEKVSAKKKIVLSQNTLNGSESILVVEDEEMVNQLMREILKSYGYNVFTARNGEEALEILQNIKVDMIITDIIMPQMGGYELAENLSKNYPQIPILFTSGYIEDSRIKHNLIDSEINFIHKPFNAKTLISKDREILETAKISN